MNTCVTVHPPTQHEQESKKQNGQITMSLNRQGVHHSEIPFDHAQRSAAAAGVHVRMHGVCSPVSLVRCWLLRVPRPLRADQWSGRAPMALGFIEG